MAKNNITWGSGPGGEAKSTGVPPDHESKQTYHFLNIDLGNQLQFWVVLGWSSFIFNDLIIYNDITS